MRYDELLNEIGRLRNRLDKLEHYASQRQTSDEFRLLVDTFCPERRGDQQYEVTLNWRCTCPSFEHQTGVDSRGHCKHIRFARNWRTHENKRVD